MLEVTDKRPLGGRSRLEYNMKVKACGVAWYASKSDLDVLYPKFKDSHNLPDSYEEWLVLAKRLRSKSGGVEPESSEL